MKSYTDLEQSKKLAEILPIESADMHYVRRTCDFRGNPVDDKWSVPKYGNPNSEHSNYIVQNFTSYEKLSCWSLTALLELMPFHIIENNQRYGFYQVKGYNKQGETYMFKYNIFNTDVCLYSTDYYNNSVDAAFEMVVWLKENGKI